MELPLAVFIAANQTDALCPRDNTKHIVDIVGKAYHPYYLAAIFDQISKRLPPARMSSVL